MYWWLGSPNWIFVQLLYQKWIPGIILWHIQCCCVVRNVFIMGMWITSCCHFGIRNSRHCGTFLLKYFDGDWIWWSRIFYQRRILYYFTYVYPVPKKQFRHDYQNLNLLPNLNMNHHLKNQDSYIVLKYLKKPCFNWTLRVAMFSI